VGHLVAISTEMVFSASLPATRVQFGLGALLQHSTLLRAAGFEDEDENEAPCE